MLDDLRSGTHAMEALAAINHPESAKALCNHLTKNPKLGRQTRKELEALGKIGTAETRAQLASYLDSCPSTIKSEVEAAIAAIDKRQEK